MALGNVVNGTDVAEIDGESVEAAYGHVQLADMYETRSDGNKAELSNCEY